MDEYTRWKASQARCWAETVRKTIQRLEARDDALKRLAQSGDGLKAVAYDRVGGSTTMVSGDDAMASYVMQSESMLSEWKTAYIEFRDIVSEFERALRLLDGSYDAILTAHYINGKAWREVASRTGYSYDYVNNTLSIRALAARYDVMPNSYKVRIPEA